MFEDKSSADSLCSVLGSRRFSRCLRLSFLTVVAPSGPESKLVEERKKKCRARECRGPLTAFCPRDRPRPRRMRAFVRMSLCRCVRMRRRLRVYYNMPCHGYTRDAHAVWAACIYAGNERVIFQRVRAMNGRLVVLVLHGSAALRPSSPSPSLILRMFGAVANP